MTPKSTKSKLKSKKLPWWNQWQRLVAPERLKVDASISEETMLILYGVFILVLLILWLLGVIGFLAVVTAVGLMLTHHLQNKLQNPVARRHVLYSSDLPWVELKGQSLQEALDQARRFLNKTGVKDPEHWAIGVVIGEKVVHSAPLDWEDSEILDMMKAARKRR